MREKRKAKSKHTWSFLLCCWSLYGLFRLNVYETPVWWKLKDKGLSYLSLGNFTKNKQTNKHKINKVSHIRSAWRAGPVISVGGSQVVPQKWALEGLWVFTGL